MKYIKTHAVLFLSAALLLSLSSCTDSVTNQEADESVQEEVEVLANVIGDALSDQNEGLISSLYDLTATLKEDSLNYRHSENREWRGPFNNFNHNYDPDTGWHTIAYRRGFTGPVYSNLIQVLLQYLFLDENDNFIEHPGEDKDLIETIEFNGMRSGYAEGPVRSSEFERTANWILEGFGPANPVMSLHGNQLHEGSMSITRRRDGVTVSRAFSMNFDLVDISIVKPTGEEGRMEYLVTGLIEYDVVLVITNDGVERTQEYSGVIELNGDGTALMRVMGLQRVFQLQLSTGEIAER